MDQIVRRNTPQEFQANELLSVTLEVQEWNAILHALNEAPMPMRIALAVRDRLLRQLQPGDEGDVSN